MTHAQMNRYIAALVVLLVAAAGWFAWMTTRDDERLDAPPAAATAPAVDPAAEAALFDARCGTCHSRGDMVAYLREGADLDARVRELADLLASHGPATTDENARIVAFLEQQAR